MKLKSKAMRQLCIPTTAVVSDPDFHVGSGMDTELRGSLHGEPGGRLVKMSARSEGIEALGCDRERSSHSNVTVTR